MSKTRRNFSAKFKASPVLEVLKGEKDINTQKRWPTYHAGRLDEKKSEELLGPNYESKFSKKPFED